MKQVFTRLIILFVISLISLAVGCTEITKVEERPLEKIVQEGQEVDMAKRTEELQDLQFGMFICWSFSTFSGCEWTPGVEDISFFNPTGFDPDQWCRVAKDAGMGYILFLTKHHDGFCLWDTQTTSRKDSAPQPALFISSFYMVRPRILSI